MGLTLSSAVRLTAGNFVAESGGRLMHEAPSVEVRPALFTPGWKYCEAMHDVTVVRDDGIYEFSMRPDSGGMITGTGHFQLRDSAVRAEYRFKSHNDIRLNCLFVTANIQADEFRGGSWSCGERSAVLPEKYDKLILMQNAVDELTLRTADGTGSVTFHFPEKVSLLIQDNRQWSKTFSVRIGRLTTFDFRKDENYNLRFSISTGSDDKLRLQRPVTLTAGRDWIPLDIELEIAKGSALDFSAMGFLDAPAGKHGRIIAEDGHFVFKKQPGKRQRFYGVNFCFSALYPDEEVARRIAQRLARIGYNTVRVHHYESVMTEGSEDGIQLNREAMRRFDRFMAELINAGIYLSIDLYVSRRVPWKAIGIDKPGSIPQDTFKKLVPVHEGAFNNLKEFTAVLLNHVNPHTGRSYANEPALAWINIINEGNFGNHFSEINEIPEWQQAWRSWLAEKKKSTPQLYSAIPETIPQGVGMSGKDSHKAAFLLFFKDLEIAMIRRFRHLLRNEIGCEALISNANGWSHYLPDHLVRARVYDYIDEHFYVDHPHFIKQKWRLPSRSPNSNPLKNSNFGGRREIYMRHYGKPFTISEYNYAAPGRFRGVGGILTGALAALQDWSGLWRFSYSHNIKDLAALSSRPIGYFDMLNDPLSLAAERASICLFLRGDIQPLTSSALIHLPEAALSSPDNIYPASKNLWPVLGWSHKIGVYTGANPPEEFEYTAEYPAVFEEYARNPEFVPFLHSSVTELANSNRALKIDNQSGSFTIITEKTCGGFCEKGTIAAAALQVTISGSAATVWISALDDLPLNRSKRMILTHLTDIQNSGIRYADEKRSILLDWGGLPHLVRRGVAEVELRCDFADKCRVFALSTGGRRLYSLPVTVREGAACFKLDTVGRDNKGVIIYEVVK